MIWNVGHGNDISFSYDNWIENRRLIEKILNLEEDIQLNPRTKVSEIISDGQ